MGDIVPLLKDLYRIRPVSITCLDPIFKIIDSTICARMMDVCTDFGLFPKGTFGFIRCDAPEWPLETAAAVQWISRRDGLTSFQYSLDATSAYDTPSHSAVSLACHLYGVPREIEDTLLATISGHERLINTAYQPGDTDTKATPCGGVAPKGLLWIPLEMEPQSI